VLHQKEELTVNLRKGVIDVMYFKLTFTSRTIHIPGVQVTLQ